MSMLFKRIKDWATTITAFRSGDVIPVDGPSGTAKMPKDDLLKETADNASGLIKKQILTTNCSYESFNTGFYLIGGFLAGNIVVKVPPNYAYRGNFKVQVNYFDGTVDLFNLGGLWGDTSEKTSTFTLAKDGDVYIYSDYTNTAGQLDFTIGYDTDLERRIKANETAISELTPALSAEIERSKNEDFYDWVEAEELENVSNVASYKVYYNSQYMLAAFRATGGITSYAFDVESGKRYRIKRCYGTGGEETPFAVLCSAEIPNTSSTVTFYHEYGDNPGGTYVELDDVDIVPDHDGVLYVMTLTTWGGASVFELEEQSVKQKVRLIDSELPKNNQWYGKKIGIIGTSVAYGSGATKAYAKTASDRLGFTIVPAVAPGLAIHIDEVVSGVPRPLTYGSLTMSNSEYVAAKAASLTDITISESPKPNSSSWTPGSASDFNNYWRCWDNVFCADNADVELWIFSTVPNNTNFANTDWDAFNKSEWRYNDNSNFADHRTTFLGAMLYLMDKMYTMNNMAKMALCLDSEFMYWAGGKAAFAKLHEQYAIPVIDLYGKITKTPQMYSAFRSGDAHPSTFGQEQLGNMFTNELLLLP